MLPLLLPLVAAAAMLKVVDEKPQEETTSSTSTIASLTKDHYTSSDIERGLYVPFCSSSESSNWRIQAAHSGSCVLAPLVLQIQLASSRSPSTVLSQERAASTMAWQTERHCDGTSLLSNSWAVMALRVARPRKRRVDLYCMVAVELVGID
jgi:hypothetical protein